MRSFFLLGNWRGLCVGLGLALGTRPVAAQLLAPSPARAYEFLTLTMVESSTKNMAKLLIAPAFNSRTEVQLEALGAFLPGTRLEHQRRNEELLTQSLGELSAAGWELMEVHASPLITDKEVFTTRYLLRRIRP